MIIQVLRKLTYQVSGLLSGTIVWKRICFLPYHFKLCINCLLAHYKHSLTFCIGLPPAKVFLSRLVSVVQVISWVVNIYIVQHHTSLWAWICSHSCLDYIDYNEWMPIYHHVIRDDMANQQERCYKLKTTTSSHVHFDVVVLSHAVSACKMLSLRQHWYHTDGFWKTEKKIKKGKHRCQQA